MLGIIIMDMKQTKKHGLKKFIILALILVGYMFFVVSKFGVGDGLMATALTWAFFVTCTPIADAGFLVDFPVRMVIGLKMIYSEIIVWALAFGFVGFGLVFMPEVFDQLKILRLFDEIIYTPWPLWLIVIISGIGTFLSIYIGDQIYSLVQQHNHHKKIKKLQINRIVVEAIMFIVIIGLYFGLLHITGLEV